LTVFDREDSYRYISALAEADEICDDEGLRDIDRLALRYTGRALPDPRLPRVSAWMRIDRRLGRPRAGRRITHAGCRADEGESCRGGASGQRERGVSLRRGSIRGGEEVFDG